MNNKKKGILIITPLFYDYYKEMEYELLKEYDEVYCRNELPFSSPYFYYVLAALFPWCKSFLWKKYENSIIKLVTQNNINKIIIIRGYHLSISFLKVLKEDCHVEIIQYQWDSLKNNPNALVISEFASKNFTFDRNDAENHSQFKYLPLFYTWRGLKGDVCVGKKYDLLFVSSWSYERFELIEKFVNFCKSNNFSYYIFIYIPLQTYIKRKIKGEKLPDLKYFHFSPMSKEKYLSLMKSSTVIFDSPSKNQTGLSMRTIETISLRKKLLTTNESVTREPLYNPQYIRIWPICSQELKKFLDDKTQYEAPHIYSLTEWIGVLLS